jgi:hypothetical protein
LGRHSEFGSRGRVRNVDIDPEQKRHETRVDDKCEAEETD